MSAKRLYSSPGEGRGSQRGGILQNIFQPSFARQDKDMETVHLPESLNGSGKYYGILVNDIMQRSGKAAGKAACIVCTSCYQGEGVSTVTSNLSAALAHGDSRVLLVDMSCPDSPNHNSSNPIHPLPDTAEVDPSISIHGVKRTRFENLFVLSPQMSFDESNRRMHREWFTESLVLLRKEFDFIIIDAPALEQGDCAYFLGNLSDGLIFVIESERVRWEVAKRAKEKLLDANVNILGVVINRRKHHIPEWLYNTF